MGRQALPVSEILSLLLNNNKDRRMKILLNETETAKQLSLKTSTLRKWRWTQSEANLSPSDFPI